MSVNYLWKFYLENDAESFQRLLLEGTLPPAASSASAHRLGGAELGGGDSSSAGGGIFGPSPGAELTETGGGGNQQDNSFKYENSPGVGSYPGTARFYKHMGISTSKVQKEEQITFTRQMLREYDPQGRLLIHLAATEAQGLPFLKALLKHPQIDVNYPDLESGWTSFHRALYHGNISAAKSIYDAEAEKAAIGLGAWPPLLVRSKDKCGEAPFEVFEGSIAGLEGRLKELYHEKEKGGRVDEDLDDSEYEAEDAEKSIKLNTGGDEVFTFGSNKNLTLGFPDEDDRQYPERLPIQRPQDLLRQLSDERFKASGYINSITQFSPTHIQDIQMSKLHTAIITSDPYSNLYICGFGHGGRLGLGNQQLTQFTPRLVPFGDKRYRVVQVALGLDHTVAVLSNGEVWTWGGNKNGQLGYSTKAESQTSQKAPLHTGQSKPKKTISSQSTAEEADYIQPTPRQVIANLKKEFVTGAAASRIHTVLHTRDSLFTFGKNEGQLGIIDSSDARTLAFQTAPRKVAASFLAEKEIVMVAATEKATVILLDNHDVWVLANYGYSRIVFPLGRVARGPSRIRNSTNSPHITKITCGGGTLCALSGMGDVFTVNLGDIGNLRGTSSNGKLAISAPQKVWDLRKKHMAVRDASIGQDGSLIVCTQSGGVWRRVRRAKKDNQTNTSTTTPGNVAPTSGIGLLFTEYKSKDYKFSRVPGLTRIVAVRGNEFGAYAAIRRDCDLMQTMLKVEHPNLWKDIHRLLSFRRAYHLEDGDSSADELSEEDGDVGPGPRSNNTLPTDPAAWFRSPDIEKRMRETLESPEASYNLKNYDMVIKSTRSNIEIPVHKAILSGRSLVLRKKLVEAGANGKATVNGDVTILASDRGDAKAQLIVKDVDILTIANLVYYFYADDLVTLWGRYTRDQNLAQRYRNHRSELATLALILQLKACYNLATGTHLPPTLDKDFKEALLDPDYFTSGDMIIQLAEGTEVQVHSAILRQRSEFFETLYEGASGRWLLYKKEQMEAMQEDAIKVDMKHVKLEVFKLVLAYLYTDKSEDLFDEVKGMETLDHFLDFVMDVLSVANELLLDRLSMTCQKVLGFYGKPILLLFLICITS